MLYLTITKPDFEELDDLLATARDFQPDLEAVEAEVRAVVVESNRQARLKGLDSDGDPLREISKSGQQQRRRRGQGAGPPLAPDGAESRVIRNFICTTESEPGRMRVAAGWINGAFLYSHAHGSGRLPVRDVVSSLAPGTIDEIHQMVADEAVRQFREATAARGPGRVRTFVGRLGGFFNFGRRG